MTAPRTSLGTRTCGRHAVGLGALVVVTLAAVAAHAQGFALDRFEPSGGGSEWFTAESLDFRGRGRPSLSLFGDWAKKPLVLYDGNGKEVQAVVDSQLFLHGVLSLNLFDRLRLGVALPFAVDQPGQAATAGGVTFPAPSGAAIGDLRLGADLQLVGTPGAAFVLAVGALVHLPTGKRADYTGDGRVRVTPRVMISGDAGPLLWAARLGIQMRPEQGGFGDVTLGNAVDGAAAVGLRVGTSLVLGPELFGQSSLESFGKGRASPVELLLGGHLRVDDFRFGAGFAPGLTDGVGTPEYRVVARLEYFPIWAELPPEPPKPGDRDQDGIFDEQDACPAEPGPSNPDPKKHGCPEPPDRDKDGVLDGEDACPDVAGLQTNDPRTNGCPNTDRDGDGISDDEDACPDVPGQRDADPKKNGCPDRDKDGIIDSADACPDAAGPADADPKKNGCPVARIEKGQIRILEQVKFRLNSAEILPESEPVLTAVRTLLEEHADIKKIRVEGHTDNRGSAPYNKKLSDRRAASVVKWLVGHGIDAGRMTSRGFGKERPIDTNKTEDGRRENRRVEFHIVDPAPSEEK